MLLKMWNGKSQRHKPSNYSLSEYTVNVVHLTIPASGSLSVDSRCSIHRQKLFRTAIIVAMVVSESCCFRSSAITCSKSRFSALSQSTKETALNRRRLCRIISCLALDKPRATAFSRNCVIGSLFLGVMPPLLSIRFCRSCSFRSCLYIQSHILAVLY